MKDIDKLILKLEVELAHTKAVVNEIIDGLFHFNLCGGHPKALTSTITKKFCKFLFVL